MFADGWIGCSIYTQLYLLAQTADPKLKKGTGSLVYAVQIESAGVRSHESEMYEDGTSFREAQEGEASATVSREVLSRNACIRFTCVLVGLWCEVQTAFFSSNLTLCRPVDVLANRCIVRYVVGVFPVKPKSWLLAADVDV